MKRYIIGTGYTPNSKTPIPPRSFLDVWLDNTRRSSHPVRIVIVTGGGVKPDVHGKDIMLVACEGDLGHIRDKHEGRTNYPLVGWTGAMMVCATIAYNECADLIYKEQDCLAFGHWVEQLYADMGMRFAALGGPLDPPHQKLTSSQSLFIVRHAAIPEFLCHYLACGEDACRQGQFGEQKFTKLMDSYPEIYKRQSPGWNMDRNRPLPFNQTTWAAQQWTPAEFDQAVKQGLISTP